MTEPLRCPCCAQPWPESLPVRRAVGWRIQLARKMRGHSQTDLGQSLSRQRTHAAISELERGKVRIDIEELVELASVLDVPLGFFVEGIALGTDPPAFPPSAAAPRRRREDR